MAPDHLSAALENLSDTDRYLVTHRFGFGGAPIKSLRQLGAELGVSPQRCRRVVSRALARFNANLLQGPRSDDGALGYG